MTIWRFPKVLVIHLKRFQNSYVKREKLNTPIDIPLKIDLEEFAPHSSKYNRDDNKLLQIINLDRMLNINCMASRITQDLYMGDTMLRKIFICWLIGFVVMLNLLMETGIVAMIHRYKK